MDQIKKLRSCYKCGFHAETPETICPQCHRPLFSEISTRVRGFLMVLCGVILMGMMGYITLWALSAANANGTTGSRFTGTKQEQFAIFALFGVIILFGFGSFVTGIGQLITGRRNKILAWAVIGLGFVILVIASGVYWIL